MASRTSDERTAGNGNNTEDLENNDMLKKIILAAAATAIIAAPALAGSHGGMKKEMMGDKMMGKGDCATMMKKMEGMKGEKYAMMMKEAKMKMKAGDEKGCMEALKGGMMMDKKMGGKMEKKM